MRCAPGWNSGYGRRSPQAWTPQKRWHLRKAGIPPVGVRVLLDTICALKLLTRDGDRYSLVPESAYYLIPGKPTYKGGIVQHEINWEANGKLADAIRSEKRPVVYDATTPDFTDVWLADYSRRWVYLELYFETDEQLWRTLEIKAQEGLRVLDLACGPAPISLALARQHSGSCYLPERSFLLAAGECPPDGNQRDLGDRQDLFIIGKVLKYLKWIT